MTEFSAHLIDPNITPDPWNPAAGDVYSRPNSMGWDRIVVLEFAPEHTRPSLHDIKQDVRVPAAVHIFDPFKHQRIELTAHGFRATIAAYDMRPSGRMRSEPAPATSEGRAS